MHMTDVERGNQSDITEFILCRFRNLYPFQTGPFVLVLLTYITTMAGNTLIIVTILVDKGLHTPMYFFLGNLSFLDIWYTSNIVPKMLQGFLAEKGVVISFSGCVTQLYIFGSQAATEILLLTVMAYDRYLAICNPLRYMTLMNWRVCIKLASCSWLGGFLFNPVLVAWIYRLRFCGPNEIDHFFCDFMPLVKLSCSDTHLITLASFLLAATATLIPFLLTLTSYAFIIAAIVKNPSSTGRQKAFSTCTSHLTVVSTFYGALAMVYIVPKANSAVNLNKIFSLLYSLVTPLLNPLVYSLRNKDVNDALRTMAARLMDFRRR
ncbi:olfactory receptor 11A1-like [Terrapene carolina triunguis]|uniref:olfactory receptor 11A1-like n=1 Tax=Terrapene triunguis TaxID=2587831 RepID=UPI000E777455|nr:olfactory receptor 11A1-like [Terrapene carolina triunguis]